MKLSRIHLGLAGWLFVCLAPLHAQDTWMPYVFGKQYSATESVSIMGGSPSENQVFVDGPNIRTETPSPGSKVVAIIRPDMQTVYWVILATKQLLMIPFDADRIGKQMPPTTTGPGRSEPLGFEMAQGIACTKFRLINDSGRKFLLWTDAAKSTPVKIAAANGSYVLVWTNYKIGPQDPSLFEPPTDFMTSQMPMPTKLPAPLRLPPEDLQK